MSYGLQNIIKKMAMKKFLTAYTNSASISASAYLPLIWANAVNMLADTNIGKALLSVNRLGPEILNDMENAPDTTIRIAAHWVMDSLSPKSGTANRATKTGNVWITADARDASSNL